MTKVKDCIWLLWVVIAVGLGEKLFTVLIEGLLSKCIFWGYSKQAILFVWLFIIISTYLFSYSWLLIPFNIKIILHKS